MDVTIILFVVAISIGQSLGTCPSGYSLVYGGSVDPFDSAVTIGASCYKLVALSTSATYFNTEVATCASLATGGFVASTLYGGELVATATIGYSDATIDSSESFWVGLDGRESSQYFTYSKSGRRVLGLSTLPFLNYTDEPQFDPSFIIFTDGVVVTDSTSGVVQQAILENQEATFNVAGFVCEANYTGTFSRYETNCNCGSYINIGKSCVFALEMSGTDWFTARMACKSVNEKADLMFPKNIFEQLSATLIHNSFSTNEAVWMGPQDFYKESDGSTPVSDPDVTIFSTPSYNVLDTTSDSDKKDFAMSFFNKWILNDAWQTVDTTYNVIGPLCQIPLDPTTCSDTFLGTPSASAGFTEGCIKSFIMRSNNNGGGSLGNYGIISSATNVSDCKAEMMDSSRGSRCMTQFKRGHNECVYFEDCTDILDETAARPAIGNIIYQYYATATCLADDACKSGTPTPYQTIANYRMNPSSSNLISSQNAGSASSCWSLCESDTSCAIASFCDTSDARCGSYDCKLYFEDPESYNFPNSMQYGLIHTIELFTGAELRRKETCEEATSMPDNTPVCVGNYTAITDPDDPKNATRCFKVISGSYQTFGEAYLSCVFDAKSYGKVGAVGSMFSSMTEYDDLWTSASVNGNVWIGTCANGAQGESNYKTMDNEFTVLADAMTYSNTACTKASNSNSLAIQDILGCTDCLGVLCMLYDETVMPDP